MKVLITGVNGFVGKYLKIEIAKLGHEVFGIDCTSQSPDVFIVDICNKTEVMEILNSVKPDIVYHLAAVSFVDSKEISTLYKINVEGTLNLLEGCSRLTNIPKFVFISSGQVYGIVPESSQPIKEDAPLNPVNYYGASKAMGEMLVKVFHAETGLEYVIFRPFNHTGSGQSKVFVVPKLVEAFKNKQNSIELGNIDSQRDYCDVRDVVRAYCLVLNNFKNSAIYNVASGKSYSIRHIIEILEILSGQKINIEISNELIRKNDIIKSVGSYNLIKRELDWEPYFSLHQTLADMLKS